MPLCVSSVIVRVTLDMAGIIITAAGLGFLGLGAQPPMPEWGAMIANGRLYVLDQWWVAAAPGAAIFIVSLALQPAGRRPARRARSEGGEVNRRAPRRAPMLVVDDLRVSFPNRDGGRPRPCAACRSRSGASASASSANRAPARRRPAAPSSASRAPEGRVVGAAARVRRRRSPALPAARERRELRGGRIAMVLQDPKFSLNPVMSHRRPDRRDAARAFARVGARGARPRAGIARSRAASTIRSASTSSIRTRSRAAWASAR